MDSIVRFFRGSVNNARVLKSLAGGKITLMTKELNSLHRPSATGDGSCSLILAISVGSV